MDAYLTAEMIKAMSEGNLVRGFAFAVVFFFIWIEVRGMKKQMEKLNSLIVESLPKFEGRFVTIENHQLQFEKQLLKFQERLTRIESPQPMKVEIL